MVWKIERKRRTLEWDGERRRLMEGGGEPAVQWEEGRGVRSKRWKGRSQVYLREGEEEEEAWERWWVGNCTVRCNRSVILQVLEELGENLKIRIALALLVLSIPPPFHLLNFQSNLSNNPQVSSSFSPYSHFTLSASAFLFILPVFWLSDFHFLFHSWNLHLDETFPLRNVSRIQCVRWDQFSVDWMIKFELKLTLRVSQGWNDFPPDICKTPLNVSCLNHFPNNHLTG